jgi:hypothetical protein
MTIDAILGTFTDEIMVTLTGTQISDASICSQLLADYTDENGGTPPTPSLFTLIAMKESTFHPFLPKFFPKYNYNGYWPNESPATSIHRAGFNIGLMMTALTNDYVDPMPTAWDWQQNANAAEQLFADKVQAAANQAVTVISNHIGLAPLTQLKLEDNALGRYNGNGTTTASQAWIVKCVNGTVSGKNCNGGQWQWVPNVNAQGVPSGAVTYKTQVRAQQPPCRFRRSLC